MKTIVFILIFSIISTFFTGGSQSDMPFITSPEEIVLSKNERYEKGLRFWPDGCIGIAKNGDEYSFYGANSTLNAKTKGNIDNLTDNVCYQSRKIIGLKKDFNYASGGPVFENPITKDIILIYHAEIHNGGNYKQFYSSIGMAVSKDGGDTFYDLGEIITPNISRFDDSCPDIVEMGGGCYVIHNDYMYIYFRDCLKNGKVNNLCVARASVEDVLDTSQNMNPPKFLKYYDGSFSQNGLGGLSSNIENKNTSNRWMDVTFNKYLNKFILVGCQISITNFNLYPHLFIMFSDDGINWGNRFKINGSFNENFYPTIIGLENNPKETGKNFYIYYTSSSGGWKRWDDASVARKLITLK